MRFNILIVILLLSCSIGFFNAKAEDEASFKANLLSVSGSGQFSVTPDIGELILGVEADSTTASEAQAKASATLTAFIGQLKGIGIQANEIKTIESSLNPIRDYNSKKPPYRIISYTAVQRIRVRVLGESRLNLVSRAIDLATKNSINRIESISFNISPELNREANRKAVVLASEDALKSGKEVLNNLGLSLVRIKEIRLNFVHRNYAYMSPRAVMMADKVGAEPATEISNIMPGELTLDATADLVLEFTKK
jgi:uncharacterized protein